MTENISCKVQVRRGEYKIERCGTIKEIRVVLPDLDKARSAPWQPFGNIPKPLFGRIYEHVGQQEFVTFFQEEGSTSKNSFCFSLDILHILVDDENHKNTTRAELHCCFAPCSANCTIFNHFPPFLPHII